MYAFVATMGLLSRFYVSRILVAALVAQTVACMVEDAAFDGEATESDFVVNGEVYAGHPSVGMVLMNGLCTGTLVSPRTMLTAKHCVEDANDNLKPVDVFSIHFGPNSANRGPGVGVTNLERHPGADIAMLTLATAQTQAPMYLNAIPMAEEIGSEVRFVGYGRTSTNQQDSGIKRTGTSLVTDVQNSGNYFGQVFHTQLGNGQGLCNGDSGGFTGITIDDVEYVAGVNSYVTGTCQDPQTKSGLVRVDVYRTWIEDYVLANDVDGLPTPPANPSETPPTPPEEPTPPSNTPPSDGGSAGASNDGSNPSDDGYEIDPSTRVGCSSTNTTTGGLWMLFILIGAYRRRHHRFFWAE